MKDINKILPGIDKLDNKVKFTASFKKNLMRIKKMKPDYYVKFYKILKCFRI